MGPELLRNVYCYEKFSEGGVLWFETLIIAQRTTDQFVNNQQVQALLK